MKLIMLPLMFSIGFIALENRDKIIDQYNAAYPSDPAKAAALEQCISENRNFNRLDADDRKHCYRKYVGPTPVAIAPSPSPSYPYSPSHLPGNDVRRQEANNSYHQLTAIPAAQAEPLPTPAAPAPPHATTNSTQRHAPEAHRVTTSQPH